MNCIIKNNDNAKQSVYRFVTSYFKYPIEYELDPGTLEKGIQWITLRLKNVWDVSLHNLDIKMHSTDSLQISFRSPSDYIYRLTPIEETYLHFQVDVHGGTD